MSRLLFLGQRAGPRSDGLGWAGGWSRQGGGAGPTSTTSAVEPDLDLLSTKLPYNIKPCQFFFSDPTVKKHSKRFRTQNPGSVLDFILFLNWALTICELKNERQRRTQEPR